eukprot:scaffold361_cov248-Pinguiococcus_pyrenoidosus.AAC.18
MPRSRYHRSTLEKLTSSSTQRSEDRFIVLVHPSPSREATSCTPQGRGRELHPDWWLLPARLNPLRRRRRSFVLVHIVDLQGCSGLVEHEGEHVAAKPLGTALVRLALASLYHCFDDPIIFVCYEGRQAWRPRRIGQALRAFAFSLPAFSSLVRGRLRVKIAANAVQVQVPSHPCCGGEVSSSIAHCRVSRGMRQRCPA